jgi:hypothetical protein
MRAHLRTLVILAAMSLCLGIPAAASMPTQPSLVAVLRAGACTVKPHAVDAGDITLQVVNRTPHNASFEISHALVVVGPKAERTRSLVLAAGRDRYSCTVADRPIAGGFLLVRTPRQIVQHRIGVREVSGMGELYDRVIDAKFVPRGSNYIRLANQKNASGGFQFYHSTFNVGQYDSGQAEAALSRMAADGYNVVRVFLNEICADACMGDPATGSLRRAYIANVVDFLRRAKSHGIFVLLTSEWLPPNTTYSDELSTVRYDWFNNINVLMLSPQGVAAQQHLWTDFVKELVRQDAPLDAIFAYELWNEAVVLSDQPPFSLTGGQVTTANGTTYDMASASDRKRMIDDGFVFLIDQVRAAIRKVDPTALVTMGFFHDTEPNPARAGDNRVVRTRAVIERSTADFVDIHPYAGDELTFSQFMQNYGIDGPTAKPIVMGEFGASKRAFASAPEAANALVSWQRGSCAYGIDGWLLWTWDSIEQPDLWNALDAGGTIEGALSPAHRPDPCA